MNETNISLTVNAIIVLVSIWAVLTHKVRTNSAEILALATICVAAALGFVDAMNRYGYIPYHELIMRSGLAMAGLAYFVRMEGIPFFHKLRESVYEDFH